MDSASTGTSTAEEARRTALLSIFANLSGTHREQEKFYGEAPLLGAAELVRTSRTLKALASAGRAGRRTAVRRCRARTPARTT